MTVDLDARVAAFVPAAYAAAPGVKRWLDQAGIAPEDIRSVADLNSIPVLTKDKLVELQATDPPFGGFLGVPMSHVERIFISPGPLYEVHGNERDWQETGAEMLRQAGFSQESVVLNALNYHLASGGFLLDGILRQLGAAVIPVGVGNADLQIKMMMELKATGYAGTPSWLLTLLRKADEMDAPREQIKLRYALVSAEPLAASDRATLVDEYGISVINAYATAELGMLAYDLEGAPAMRLVESPVVQLVDRDTGEEVGPGDVGEVVVTNLNMTYPLIRLGTGDLAMNIDPAPGESSQGQRSIRLVGRVGDAIKVRGMFVHPNQVRAALGQHGISDFSAVVERPDVRDMLTLQVVAPAELANDDAFVEELRAAFRQICRINLDALEFVESVGDEAGKIVDKRSWD